jgi:NADH dehydrogenase [ubiquinone] 1 alpha subcomplex assembly factor 7
MQALATAPPTDLEARIAELIEAEGPIDVATFMTLALGHPTSGYYPAHARLGATGDFVTSPEISQIFGELIGLALADAWRTAGGPATRLVELGPGNGTLLADLWRSTAKLQGFQAALDVHLVETSPALRRLQAERLAPIQRLQWHGDLVQVPADRPLLLVANELFDALPIRQFIKEAEGWHEIQVALDADRRLCLGRSPGPSPLGARLPADLPSGSVVELSPARDALMAELADRLRAQSGLALIIDYGEAEPTPGSTLQAVHRHQMVDPLTRPGEVDLSSRVAFGPLARIARKAGLQVFGPLPQGDFLARLGAALRLAQLVRGATAAQARALEAGHRRLTAADGMGTLFKVMAVTRWPLVPPGFVAEEAVA